MKLNNPPKKGDSVTNREGRMKTSFKCILEIRNLPKSCKDAVGSLRPWMKNKVDVLQSEELWGVARQEIFHWQQWGEAATENGSIRTWEHVCGMKGSKPRTRVRWSSAWNGGTGNCAASDSPLTSTPSHDEKQWDLGKKRPGKTFQRTVLGQGRPPCPGWKLVARLVATERRCEWPASEALCPTNQHLQNNSGHGVWWLYKMTQNAQPWISLWKGAEGSCDRVTGLLKCWVKFKVAKWEILHVVGDTALTLQVSKPSSDIAQTSNKQVRNFCLSCSQSRARREKKRWFVISVISRFLVAKLDTGLGAGHQAPNLTWPPASPSPQKLSVPLSAW